MYRSIKNIVPRNYCEEIAEIVRNQPAKCDDNQVIGSAAYYNIPAASTLLGMLLPFVQNEIGKELLPTYAYCRIYNFGNELVPHTDREACEWSVTINISQTHNWPIYMEDEPIDIQTGDGVIYQGNCIKHYRKPFEGVEYIQLFLHYVDANGPYADEIFDKGRSPGSNIHRFIVSKQNIHIQDFVKIPQVFSEIECKSIINEFSPRTTNKAIIGSGNDMIIDPNIRTSMIYWIPKSAAYSWIYMRILNMVSKTNTESFDFDITEIEEDIQYTEYDESFSGHYMWHTDIGKYATTNLRKISVSVQLSDPSDYDGCELQIGDNDSKLEKADKSIGSATMFPSFKRHQVTPVTRGKRCCLVAWISGPPFR
jgi:PKHD-type hydroxylase